MRTKVQSMRTKLQSMRTKLQSVRTKLQSVRTKLQSKTKKWHSRVKIYGLFYWTVKQLITKIWKGLNLQSSKQGIIHKNLDTKGILLPNAPPLCRVNIYLHPNHTMQNSLSGYQVFNNVYKIIPPLCPCSSYSSKTLLSPRETGTTPLHVASSLP